ncbi:hypothetical protein CIHG_07745 [Coccidioides immitis H538.4]|uniref:Uncharacterized protein n=3 Tax=Coccidioides immitis TaxID=5501 RepID=A0A0J8U4X0_COCIT|nr:hypothetical protein CIRG_04219 [Coccidioides immitis RMSCC 2394]KMU81952.1 hypothetical protein CISG_09414 [Coccidioides immitis RMSCC 3703]KMU90061.1 hypothetical protein CIHG_07745 [Coccidioides immitis H538.4]
MSLPDPTENLSVFLFPRVIAAGQFKFDFLAIERTRRPQPIDLCRSLSETVV